MSELPLSLRVFVAAIALPGCAPSVTFEIASHGPDELLVVARVRPNGELVSAERLGASASVEADEGDTIVLYSLPRAELVDWEGRYLADDTLEQLQVLTEAPSGSCRRCLVPPLAPPLVVESGDVCNLPAFARAEVFDVASRRPTENPELGELVRSRVWLAWPGPCACSVLPAEGATRLDVCPVGGQVAGVAATVHVVEEDGSAVGVSAGHIYRVEQNGSVTLRQLVPALEDLVGGTLVEGGTIVLVERTQTDFRRSARLSALDRSFSKVAGLDKLPILAQGVVAIQGGAHVFGALLAGLGQEAPGGLDCLVHQGIECRPISADPSCSEADPIAAVVTLPSGGMFGLTTLYGSVRRAPEGAEWSCDAIPPFPDSKVRLGDLELQLTLLPHAANLMVSLSRRVVTCVHGVSGPTQSAVVVTATVSDLVGDEPVRFEALHVTPDAECLAAFEDSGHAFVTTHTGGGAGETVEVDVEGRVAGVFGVNEGPFASLGHVARSVGHGAGSTVATGFFGNVLVRPNGSSTFSTLAPLSSPAGLAPKVAVRMVDGRFAVVSSNGAAAIDVAGGCAAEEIQVLEAPWDGFWPPTPAGATDSRGLSRVAVAGRIADRTVLRFLDFSGSDALRDEDLPLSPATAVQELAELTPGLFLILDELGRLRVWDDATSELRSISLDAPMITIGVSEGIGWAAGVDAIHRVVPVGVGRYRAEDWLTRTREGAFDDVPRDDAHLAHFAALDAVCPDRVTLAAIDPRFTSAPSAVSVWTLGPGNEGSLELVPAPFVDRLIESVAAGSDTPVAIAGVTASPLFVFANKNRNAAASLYLDGAPRAALPFGATWSVAGTELGSLVTEDSHRVALVARRAR
ncbi:MAG: hypothetical protein HYV07_01410 [Deltaproteobacteria bacterium]|nr:hypothetical protein [Deltaproteobacteria bacterium]